MVLKKLLKPNDGHPKFFEPFYREEKTLILN